MDILPTLPEYFHLKRIEKINKSIKKKTLLHVIYLYTKKITIIGNLNFTFTGLFFTGGH